MIQPTYNEKGEKEMDIMSVSAALQIAGRAGRYGTAWSTVSIFKFISINFTYNVKEILKDTFALQGYVTTFKREDLPTLKNLLNQTPEVIIQAGLHPTADQIELYAYHLPNSPLSNLMVRFAETAMRLIINNYILLIKYFIHFRIFLCHCAQLTILFTLCAT